MGYPKVAAFENSDPSFLIYRKFGWLHTRLLLYRQAELVDLENKLGKLDQKTFRDDNHVKLLSKRLDFGSSPERRDLVNKIAEKLEIYGISTIPGSAKSPR